MMQLPVGGVAEAAVFLVAAEEVAVVIPVAAPLRAAVFLLVEDVPAR